MALSNYLAELWGILLVIIPIAMIAKQEYIKELFESAQDDKKLFCWGVLTLTIGLAMVLAYNIWDKNWQVIITILGWASLIKGLAILFMPKFFKNQAAKIQNKTWLPFALIVAVFIGLALTYLGFTA